MIVIVYLITVILFLFVAFIEPIRHFFFFRQKKKNELKVKLNTSEIPALPTLLDQELEAAKARQSVIKREPPPPPLIHPLQASLEKAIPIFAREWGLHVDGITHNIYDFFDHDKHCIYVRFEVETKKIKKKEWIIKDDDNFNPQIDDS